MAKDFKADYDVFISYSSGDKEWVRSELLRRIELSGLKVFIDFRDFTRGAPSITEMERGVKTCRKTLLVITPDYLKSNWTKFETLMLQTLDPANENLTLIPLVKVQCDAPSRISYLTYIDFSDGADLDLAWRQLLTALGRPPDPEPPKQPERNDWFLVHPYPMPPDFTGRVAERATLTNWLRADDIHPLLVLRALGGFGKSALAWHWLMHDVKPTAWPRVVWWSFYEGDASFDNFVAQTLHYLGGGKIDPETASGKNGLNTLQQILHQPGTLLVLDGFERSLRAFGGLEAAYQGDDADFRKSKSDSDGTDRDCSSPLAEDFLRNVAVLPDFRSKILLTTRLVPRVLEGKWGGLLQGCREEELRQMQPADAVEFFRAKSIRGTKNEIQEACEPYGYHPLSLSILAGWIVKDLQQPGDIAAAKRLDVSGDLVRRQHHVLQTAYESLTPERQRLLGRIACFRSPVSYEALKSLAKMDDSTKRGTPVHSLDTNVRDLVARALLHQSIKKVRFDLHPIVRRYAYDRLALPDRTAAHTQLRDYFAAVPEPNKVSGLEDLTSVIELYHHTVRAGHYEEAFELFRDRLATTLYYQLGAYPLIIDLLCGLFKGRKAPRPSLRGYSPQAWTLNELANSYSLSGQPRNAVPLFEFANEIYSNHNQEHLGVSLANLAYTAQIQIGQLQAAEVNLRRAIELSKTYKARFKEAIAREELARLLAYCGRFNEALQELDASSICWNEDGRTEPFWWDADAGEKRNSVYRGRLELLRLRSASESGALDSGVPESNSVMRLARSVMRLARRALGMAVEYAQKGYSHERSFIRAYWLLGAACRAVGNYAEAEHNLHEALKRCRRTNFVEFEADVLVDLARVRAACGATDEAQRLAQDALVITERSGYVIQGADAHLELAKLAFVRDDRRTAREHAQKARDLATCDGPPNYTYKVAYDEAGALLKASEIPKN